jgi:hypothetical protein
LLYGWAGRVGALTLALFAVGVPLEFALLQTPCPTPICATGQLPQSGLRALSDLGLSPAFYAAGSVAMDIIFAAVYAVVAAFIFWRRSTDRVAVFASLALLLFGTATFGFTFSSVALAYPSLQLLVSALHFLGAACFGLFLYVFPTVGSARMDSLDRDRLDRLATGRAPRPRLEHRSCDLAGHLRVGGLADRPGHRDLLPDPSIPKRVHLAAKAADQVGCIRHRGGVDGILVINVALSAFGALPEPETPRELLAYLLGYSVASYLPMLIVPITIGIAILRYRLLDIDLVISRTLVYGTLSGCVIGIYLLVVGALGMAVQTPGNLLASLLAVGVIAVAFAPARSRLQRAVNRLSTATVMSLTR